MRMQLLGAVVLASACLAQPSWAADSTSVSVIVSAQFSSRVSLKVSTDLLRFAVAARDQAPTMAVEFSAAARTQAGAEVLLSVEPLDGVKASGGPSNLEPSVSFAGEGAGALGGELSSAGATVAGRWTGSGLRRGRIVFALSAAEPGVYTVPVRFVLSAP